VILPRLTIPDPLYGALWAARAGRTVPEVIVVTLEDHFLGRVARKVVSPVPSRPLLEWVTVVDSEVSRV